MAAIDGHITEAEIGEAVEGKTTDKRTALRQLVEAGKLRREGSGKKGDPYRYSLSEKCLFPCSPHIPGTRKQESEKTGYPLKIRVKCLFPRIWGNRANPVNHGNKNPGRICSPVSPLSATRINRMDAGATAENDMTARRTEVYSLQCHACGQEVELKRPIAARTR